MLSSSGVTCCWGRPLTPPPPTALTPTPKAATFLPSHPQRECPVSICSSVPRPLPPQQVLVVWLLADECVQLGILQGPKGRANGDKIIHILCICICRYSWNQTHTSWRGLVWVVVTGVSALSIIGALLDSSSSALRLTGDGKTRSHPLYVVVFVSTQPSTVITSPPPPPRPPHAPPHTHTLRPPVFSLPLNCEIYLLCCRPDPAEAA